MVHRRLEPAGTGEGEPPPPNLAPPRDPPARENDSMASSQDSGDSRSYRTPPRGLRDSGDSRDYDRDPPRNPGESREPRDYRAPPGDYGREPPRDPEPPWPPGYRYDPGSGYAQRDYQFGPSYQPRDNSLNYIGHLIQAISAMNQNNRPPATEARPTARLQTVSLDNLKLDNAGRLDPIMYWTWQT